MPDAWREEGIGALHAPRFTLLSLHVVGSQSYRLSGSRERERERERDQHHNTSLSVGVFGVCELTQWRRQTVALRAAGETGTRTRRGGSTWTTRGKSRHGGEGRLGRRKKKGAQTRTNHGIRISRVYITAGTRAPPRLQGSHQRIRTRAVTSSACQWKEQEDRGGGGWKREGRERGELKGTRPRTKGRWGRGEKVKSETNPPTTPPKGGEDVTITHSIERNENKEINGEKMRSPIHSPTPIHTHTHAYIEAHHLWARVYWIMRPCPWTCVHVYIYIYEVKWGIEGSRG